MDVMQFIWGCINQIKWLSNKKVCYKKNEEKLKKRSAGCDNIRQ
jgi:hypothetical protein